jgi:DNA repair exonuclease SbcCD ATPase subunit
MNFAADIPSSIASAAHAGTSFVPDRRAQQERDGYAETLAADYADLAKLADTDEKKAILEEEFARYRAGYKARTLAHLSARSRCVSPMIAGPSNFPVRQMEKRNATERRRLEELVEYRPRALDAIRKKLCPELRPIMSGDSDAVERLQEKIQEAEQLQEQMKAINAAIRKHKKGGFDARLAAIVALGISEETARDSLKPDCFGGIGYPSYRLSNNNANIARMKQRLGSISRARTQPHQEVEGANARFEDCPADNRVRLFFPGKPDADVRNTLKGLGFRWTPSLGCWQAYRNQRAYDMGRQIAGVA